MKATIEQIKEYQDLYGWSLAVKFLKGKFSHVSWRKSSIPNEGSLTLPTDKLNENNDTIIHKVIYHKNGTLTMVTDQGWLKFINL